MTAGVTFVNPERILPQLITPQVALEKDVIHNTLALAWATTSFAKTMKRDA